jgi:lauroyl/myristoyl acyltransferase
MKSILVYINYISNILLLFFYFYFIFAILLGFFILLGLFSVKYIFVFLGLVFISTYFTWYYIKKYEKKIRKKFKKKFPELSWEKDSNLIEQAIKATNEKKCDKMSSKDLENLFKREVNLLLEKEYACKEDLKNLKDIKIQKR